MTNLLPDSYKEKILKEYSHRRLIVSLIMLSLIGIISAIALFPSYVVVQKQLGEAKDRLGQIEAIAEENEINKHINRLREANDLASALEPPSAEVRYYVVTNSILENKNFGISIESMSFNIQQTSSENEGEGQKGLEKKQVRISISGIAENRDALIEFEKSMKGISYIDRVELPVSNFAAQNDINFSMELFGNF